LRFVFGSDGFYDIGVPNKDVILNGTNLKQLKLLPFNALQSVFQIRIRKRSTFGWPPGSGSGSRRSKKRLTRKQNASIGRKLGTG
jgi:hypothetical protein